MGKRCAKEKTADMLLLLLQNWLALYRPDKVRCVWSVLHAHTDASP